jgi:hypothetical protein
MKPRRLTLFVEGEGDQSALPVLANRVLNEIGGYDALFVDDANKWRPIRVSSLGKLAKDDGAEWLRLLTYAGKTRHDPAGVLLVLDGDTKRVSPQWKTYIQRSGSDRFCGYRAAAILGEQAKQIGAGVKFSVATVFIMREFEAWLLAGIESLRGKSLAENRGIVPQAASVSADYLFEVKRDAKRELRKQIPQYQESLDQLALARQVDLAAIRSRCRSFRRFESAIRSLVVAARNDRPTITPQL